MKKGALIFSVVVIFLMIIDISNVGAIEFNYNVSLTPKITKVSSGSFHTVALSEEGEVFSFGYNNSGQLGTKDNTGYNTPKIITNNFDLLDNEKVIDVSSGELFTVALSDQGRVFAFGDNLYGQLGTKDNIGSKIPKDITYNFRLVSNEMIVGISSGKTHTIAISNQGRIFTFGGNDYGQLGTNDNVNHHIPQDITYNFGLDPGEKIIDVSTGNSHTVAISDSGRVFTFGRNNYGQLGLTSDTYFDTPQDITSGFNLKVDEKIISSSSGASHTVVLSNQGRVFSFGCNHYGQLGVGGGSYYTLYDSPQNITNKFKLNLGESIIMISSGKSHILAITDQGRVFSIGYNRYGQLGTKDLSNRDLPEDITDNFNFESEEKITMISTGDYHSFAISNQGRLYSFGNNYYGQIGTNDNLNYNAPQLIIDNFGLKVGERIKSVFGGYNQTIALSDKDKVFTFGYNAYGQLGTKDNNDYNSPQDITNNFSFELGEKIVSISNGEFHTATISNKGKIYTFGYNGYGQLGNGTNLDLNYPEDITSSFNLAEEEKIIKSACGYTHTVVITDMGRLFTFGYNDFGQLGTNDNKNYNVPQDITSSFNFESGEKIEDISSGRYHTIALTSTNRVFTFGYNEYGQLGTENHLNYNTPKDITSNFYLDTDEKIISISGGTYHTVALSDKGRVFTIGYNYNGELGTSNNLNYNTPFDITENIDLHIEDRIVNLSSGYFHTVLLSDQGNIYSFGSNKHGQLGTLDYIDYNQPINITSNILLASGEKIVNATTGNNHTVLTSNLGKVYSFGGNEHGQLGTSDFDNYTTYKNIVFPIHINVNQIEHEGIYNHDLIISFDGSGIVSAFLDNVEVANGSIISEEGDYELVIRNNLGNSENLNFSIDKSGPIISGVNGGVTLNSDILVSCDDKNNIDTFVYSQDDGVSWIEIDDFEMNFIYNGKYILKAIDTAGNESLLTFSISKTNPYLSISDNSNIESNVLVLEVFSEDPDWNDLINAYDNLGLSLLVTDEMVNSSNVLLNEVGSYFVKYNVEDNIGLETMYTLTVEVVDRVAPEYEIINDKIKIRVGSEFDFSKYIKVTDNYDGDITNNVNIKGMFNNSKKGTKEIILIASDSSGNSIEIPLTITLYKSISPLGIGLIISGAVIAIMGGAFYFKKEVIIEIVSRIKVKLFNVK